MAAYCLKHAADLSVSTLADGHVNDGQLVARTLLDDGNILGRRHAVVKHDAHPEVRDGELVNKAAHDGSVGLGDTMGRVRERLSEIAVIRQEQEPCRFGIEPAYRVDALSCTAHKIHDRSIGMAVTDGGDDAGGLVERDVDEGDFGPDAPTVHPDIVGLRVSLCAEFGDRCTVNADAARRDERLARASRRDSGSGQ